MAQRLKFERYSALETVVLTRNTNKHKGRMLLWDPDTLWPNGKVCEFEASVPRGGFMDAGIGNLLRWLAEWIKAEKTTQKRMK
jgi:hypothetical protein